MIKTGSVALLALILSAHWRLATAEDIWPPGASTQPVSEDDYIGDVPKVLTVSRLSQPLTDAPSAVTIIDRETIRAAGIVDLPEVFRLVPGFYVGINAGYVHSTNYAVSYHGMTSAYSGAMQVLINGRSVYNPLYGGVQWSELPIAVADIERIEVTRGPNAASYGANSFFGVINIITQNPSEVAANSIISTYGNGRNEVFYRHAGKLNDLSYRITTGYREDDGLDNRDDFKRTRLLNAQADYQLDERNSLEFEFGLANGVREEGNLDKDNILFLPRTKKIDNHYELVRWRHNISDNSDFSLQAYHSYDHSDDRATSVNLRPLVRTIALEQGRSLAQANALAASLLSDNITVINEVITERSDIEAQHNFSIGKTLRAVWGGSIRQDTMYAPHYLGTDKTDYFNLQRLFGHVEWQAHEKLVFNLGAMVEHNDFTGTDISPRASINLKLSPNHAIRFGVSTALRTPNYVEEKFDRKVEIPTSLPNTTLLAQYSADQGNLNPEHITSREIGYLGKVGNFSLDARLFNDDIKNYIRSVLRTDFLAPAGFVLVKGPKTALNGGNVEVRGFETQVKWRISNDTHALVNYAYVRIYGDENVLDRDLTQSMPHSTISALLTRRLTPQWDASIAYYQVGAVTALADGDPLGLTRRTDVRLARQFTYSAYKGEVAVAIENLFNDHYHEFADYNTLRRRANVTVRLDF